MLDLVMLGLGAGFFLLAVAYIRQKIELDPERPDHILTETGVGYRLRVHE